MNGTDTSTTFTDATGRHTMTASGNAQIDTAQSVFGGASGLFDGNQDYVSTPDSSDWDLGQTWTIDFRMRRTGTSGILISKGGQGIDIIDRAGWNIRYGGGNLIWEYRTDGMSLTRISNAFSPSENVWYHVAVTCDSSGNLRMFIDGTQIGTTQSQGTVSNSTSFTLRIGIAHSDDDGGDYSGWIDEVRIVKGTAVWTSNFTPPTSEYSPA
jgi:hypothetical protein